MFASPVLSQTLRRQDLNIAVEPKHTPRDLLNRRMAYVSVSRGRYVAQIYTNNAETLGQELSRDVSIRTRFSKSQ